MIKETSENLPAKTTRNGNKLFNGIEDAKGNGFSSTNQPTPEQKSAGWQKKKAREEFVNKIYGKLLDLADKDDLTNREIIDLGKIAIEISGDKKNTSELQGNVGVQKVFITEKEHKETMQHIKDVINEQ